jgi:serine/threonine protein kinase
MGAVYLARDAVADVDVAVKVVRRTLADDPEAIARFKREIRLMAEVQDPHIVRAVDAGDDAGVLWIAMELIAGQSLRERLDGRGRWPWADTLPVVRQIAQALGAAHARGVIHRDLKPENVMLVDGDGGPRVKLLDFGVARQNRASDAAATHMTGTGLLVGTPGYVAPEVVLEGTVDDPRSDFYALGVTWFELLTGQKPFTAKTPMALALRHAHELPPTPSSLLPFAPVPGPVEALVMRLLAKTPAERPADTVALIAAINALQNAAEQANTPLSTSLSTPTSLSPGESTVTSLGDGTGVVPFVGTPRPLAPVATPLALTPPASTTAVTGLPVAAPAPPASSPPRRTLAAAVVGVVVVIGLLAALAVRVTRDGDGEYRRRGLIERRDDRRARIDLPSPPLVAVAAPPVPPPTTTTATTTTPVPPTPEPPKVPTPPTPPTPRRPGRLTPPPPATVADNRRGTITLVPMPRGHGWRVSVDGGPPRETPWTLSTSAGAHTLVFTSAKMPAPITRTIVVAEGVNPAFTESLAAP